MAAEAVVLSPQGAEWQPARPGARCRWPGCMDPAVLMLDRGQYRHGHRSPMWWNYCGEHAYGRVQLHDGIYHAFEVPDA